MDFSNLFNVKRLESFKLVKSPAVLSENYPDTSYSPYRITKLNILTFA